MSTALLKAKIHTSITGRREWKIKKPKLCMRVHAYSLAARAYTSRSPLDPLLAALSHFHSSADLSAKALHAPCCSLVNRDKILMSFALIIAIAFACKHIFIP